MKNKHLEFKVWQLPVLLIVLTLSVGIALAGSKSTNLPNGAALTVSVDDPVTSTEFLVPVGESAIDVDVSGAASVGLGEPDATLVYVIDVSNSTSNLSGGNCGGDRNGDGDSNTILDCEVAAVLALNAVAVSGGSVDEVGVAVYGETGAAADMTPGGGDDPITAADASGVATVVQSVKYGKVEQFTNKNVGGYGTDFSAGLAAARSVVNASTNGTKIVVFLSDGESNEEDPPGFNSNLNALVGTGAVIYAFAVGQGSSCTGGSNGTLQGMADASQAAHGAGSCTHVTNPAALPDILPDLIGSTLESLEIEVDGGGKSPVSNDDIAPDLPLDGPASVNYATTVVNLGPGDHEICVTANGSDTTGGSASVTQCETIHLLQLTAAQPTGINNLNAADEHTVTATILGDPGQVSGRMVTFQVLGQNAGAGGTCSPNADCTTDGSGQVLFGYSVPVEPDSAGTDNIQVSTIIAGQLTSVELTKEWLLLTADPPEETNELGIDNQHAVTATVWGNPTLVSGIQVDFEVLGQNAGATGTGMTDSSGQVSFGYSVPVEPDSVGTDIIQVEATIAGQLAYVPLTKHWVDTTPPVVACVETTNPAGKKVPPGNNPDGFYELTAVDLVDPDPQIFVVDTGSGTVFGPFPNGTRIKYTQAPGAKPKQKKMSGAIDWHITGNGDAGVYAVDVFSNSSDTVSCLVPPPPF